MNYEELLHYKVNYGYFWISFIVISIIIGGYILNIKVHDVIHLKGISDGEFVYVKIPIDYSDTLKNGEYIKIGTERHAFEIISISPIEVEPTNLIEYQEYTLKIDKDSLENEVMDITIYYMKEKILDKVKKII